MPTPSSSTAAQRLIVIAVTSSSSATFACEMATARRHVMYAMAESRGSRGNGLDRADVDLLDRSNGPRHRTC